MTLSAEEIEKLADELGQMVVDVALDRPAPQSMETGSEAWHAKRRQGIGGSDITTVLGLNPWSNPQTLWRLKTGREQPTPGNVYTRRGQTMERDLVAWYSQATGNDTQEGKSARHKAWPHIRLQGNADGHICASDILKSIGCNGDGLLEIKTTHKSTAMAAKYLSGNIPLAHLLQVHVYMDIFDYQWADIMVAIGKDKKAKTWPLDDCQMLAFRAMRNDKLKMILQSAAIDFWQCVDTDRPPVWGRHRRASEAVNASLCTQITKLLGRLPNEKDNKKGS